MWVFFIYQSTFTGIFCLVINIVYIDVDTVKLLFASIFYASANSNLPHPSPVQGPNCPVPFVHAPVHESHHFHQTLIHFVSSMDLQ